MTDHTREARSWLEKAQQTNITVSMTTALTSIAQTHALLAIAQELRMANLAHFPERFIFGPGATITLADTTQEGTP